MEYYLRTRASAGHVHLKSCYINPGSPSKTFAWLGEGQRTKQFFFEVRVKTYKFIGHIFLTAMWADGASLRNEIAMNMTDFGNENNFDKFEFESGKWKVDKFEEDIKEVDQMVSDRLNCTESVLLSPYFQGEAKRLRDQAR